MKKSIKTGSWLISIFLLSLTALSYAQNSDNYETIQDYRGNCTSIMVGRLATTDGSVISSHTCDGPYRTWLEVFPHAKYEKGAIHDVYSGMLVPRETSWDMRNALQSLIQKRSGS